MQPTIHWTESAESDRRHEADWRSEAGLPAPARVIVADDTLRADRMGLAGYSRATTPNLDRWFGSEGRVHLRLMTAF